MIDEWQKKQGDQAFFMLAFLCQLIFSRKLPFQEIFC
jgi:hypothetical protein